MSRGPAVAATAGPAVVLAAVGLTHPHHLDASTAPWWTAVHVLLIPLSSAVLLGRHGRRALPGAVVLVAASWSFVGAHIYWPVGVLTGLGLAVGFALLARLPAPGARLAP